MPPNLHGSKFNVTMLFFFINCISPKLHVLSQMCHDIVTYGLPGLSQSGHRATQMGYAILFQMDNTLFTLRGHIVMPQTLCTIESVLFTDNVKAWSTSILVLL